jgi:hypothetical protein
MDGAISEVIEATRTSPVDVPPGRVSVTVEVAVAEDAVLDPTLVIPEVVRLETVSSPVLVTVLDPVAFVAVSFTVYVPATL